MFNIKYIYRSYTVNRYVLVDVTENNFCKPLSVVNKCFNKKCFVFRKNSQKQVTKLLLCKKDLIKFTTYHIYYNDPGKVYTFHGGMNYPIHKINEFLSQIKKLLFYSLLA